MIITVLFETICLGYLCLTHDFVRINNNRYSPMRNKLKRLSRMSIRALMAEWLRRVIRNHLGSSRAGSNPVQCDLYFYLIIFKCRTWAVD